MFLTFCVFAGLLASASCSINVIGEIDDAVLPSMDGFSNFLETAVIPSIAPHDFAKRMVVARDFQSTFGLVTMPDKAKFSKEEVNKLVADTDILKDLGMEDVNVFNGTQMRKIISMKQDAKYVYRRNPDPYAFEGRKMCYCHNIFSGHSGQGTEIDTSSGSGEADDEDTGSEEGGDDDDSSSEGLAYFAALWVGGPKSYVIADSDDTSSVEYEHAKGGEGQVFYNPGHEGHDERICLPGTSTASKSTQTGHVGENVCEECCVMAIGMGTVKNNPKFWGSTGCPKVDYATEDCAVGSLAESHASFHYHLRNLESLKMFSITTRSRDLTSYCDSFSKSLPGKHAQGYLIDKDCERQVSAYELLAGGNLDFLNAHELAVRACQMDGKCGSKLDMKAAWYQFSGPSCATCLARSYTAAIDLSVLTRNLVDTSLFCKMENSIHPYFQNQMSAADCKNVVRKFHENSGAEMTTAVDMCSSQCTFSASTRTFRTKSGQKSHSMSVSEISDPSFWTYLEL